MKLASLLLFLFVNLSIAQVGIGTTNPSDNAILDLDSPSKGLMLPRVNNSGLVTNPSAGLVIYDKQNKAPYFFNGNTWNSMVSSASLGSDSIAYLISTSVPTGGILPPSHFPALDFSASYAQGNGGSYDLSKVHDQNSITLSRIALGVPGNSPSTPRQLDLLEVRFFVKGATSPYAAMKLGDVTITSIQKGFVDGALVESYSFTADKFGYISYDFPDGGYYYDTVSGTVTAY